MKIKSLLIFGICLLCIDFAKAQQSPINCGIQYFYDAAGNRILRMEVNCQTTTNGGGTGSTKELHDSTLSNLPDSNLQSDNNVLATIQIVMMAPNPTGGPFNITCNQILTNAVVTIVDMSGQIASQSTVNGMTIPMDISNLNPGAYTVIVTSNGSIPTAKTLIKITGH